MTQSPPRDAMQDPAWLLFLDWCEAVGASALPATVGTISRFFDDVPASVPTLRARLQAIRRAHHATGAHLAVAREPQPRPWRSGDGWLPLGLALDACPSGGWPSAFRGRRDAWILVLLSPLVRRTRRQVLDLRTKDIIWPQQSPSNSPGAASAPITVAGAPIVANLERPPSECPACAVTRWLRVAGLENRWGKASVREFLIREPGVPVEHDCLAPAPRKWREVWQLAPAIDQHGWVVDWRPMSARSVSLVAATRLRKPAHGRGAPMVTAMPVPEDQARDAPDPVHSDARLALAGASEEDLWDLLEQRVTEADAVNARIAAFLDDSTDFVARHSVKDTDTDTNKP